MKKRPWTRAGNNPMHLHQLVFKMGTHGSPILMWKRFELVFSLKEKRGKSSSLRTKNNHSYGLDFLVQVGKCNDIRWPCSLLDLGSLLCPQHPCGLILPGLPQPNQRLGSSTRLEPIESAHLVPAMNIRGPTQEGKQTPHCRPVARS